MAFYIEDAPGQSSRSSGAFTIEDAPKPMGQAANADFLRAELRNADWGTRNIAGFGTAVSNYWEKLKQLVGQGDPQQIEANKVIEQEAPVGAIAGNVAATAIPFGVVGNTVGSAAKVGTVLGALNPIEGETSVWNKKGVTDTLKDMAGSAVLSAAGQGVANKVGEAATNKLQELAAAKARNAPIDKTLGDALDAGLVVPPSDVNPSLANTIKESIAGKVATAQQASNQNAPKIDMLARRAVGLADDAPLEPATLKAVRDHAYQQGYKPIADMQSLPKDGDLLLDLAKASPLARGSGAVENAGAKDAQKVLADIAGHREWTGQQLIGDIRLLREQSRANYGSADRAGGDVAKSLLAKTQKAAADALEGLAARNISPEAVDSLREARTLIARSHDVEDALVEGGGTIDARKLARTIQSGGKLSGELETIGRFANNYKRAVQPVQQIGGPGVNKLDLALAAAGGGIGYGEGGGGGGLTGALVPLLAPRAARAYLLSDRSQNALRALYRPGLPLRMANSLRQYAPVAGAVLGREALSK